MGIESALAQWEHECWCDYNHEHNDENGNWVYDDEEDERTKMESMVDEKLLRYIPKKNQKHIVQLWKACGKISFVMKWEDGWQRSRVADNIAEMKEMIETLEENREAEF